MKIISYFVRNPVAVNLLMLGILFAGIYVGWFVLIREFFPNFEPEKIYINVAYPGATPEEIEKSVTKRIEREIEDVDNVKEVNSTIFEGLSMTVVSLEPGTKTDKALNDLRGEMDRVEPYLPADTEDPEIRLIRPLIPCVAVAVYGSVPEDRLHDEAIAVREELLDLPGVTEVMVSGNRRREIWAEIRPDKLEEFELTFDEVGQMVGAGNLDLPGGQLKGNLGNVSVRTTGESDQALELENLVIKSLPDGTAIRLRDLAEVRATFEDKVQKGRFAGKPAVMVIVLKSPEEDAIQISDTVKKYARENPERLGGAIEIATMLDLARLISQRLDLMVRNARWGLLLVVITLAFFLNLRVAFWVAAGLPISFLGTFLAMQYLGLTINLISLFGLIVVLGLIVDDAIVIGESVFTRMRSGYKDEEAAIHGTARVAMPVVAAVLTTCAAFSPLGFVDGELGNFLRVLPIIMIAALLVSLIDAFIILPAHLAHLKSNFGIVVGMTFAIFVALWVGVGLGPLVTPIVNSLDETADRTLIADWLEPFLAFVMASVIVFSACLLVKLAGHTSLFKWFKKLGEARNNLIEVHLSNLYERGLRTVLAWRYVAFGGIIGISIATVGLVLGDVVPWEFLQDVDGEHITITLEMAAGSPEEDTIEVVKMIEDLVIDCVELESVFSVVGSAVDERQQQIAADPETLAQLTMELKPADWREAQSHRTSAEIVSELRSKTTGLPGVAKLSFVVANGAIGGPDIEVQVVGEDFEMVTRGVNEVRDILGTYPAVEEVEDDLKSGKMEARFQLRDSARLLGITTQDIAFQIRHALFGFEVQRLQEDDEEIRVRVLLPVESRSSLSDLGRLRVPTPHGGRVPLEEVSEVSTSRGYATLSREGGRRIVGVRAEVGQSGNVGLITADLQTKLDAAMVKFPGISMSFGGQARELNESVMSLLLGFGAAFLMIYGIIAVLFRSYLQPMIVMCVIPFAFVGAILGHGIAGYPITFFSLIGMVALMGIVVNDSLILVDYTNQLSRKGMPLFEAAVQGGKARLRAILLTTITTVAGLGPLMLERSFQAQFLIPMAVSIVYGLMFATALTLLVLPTLYLMFGDVKNLFRWTFTGNWHSVEELKKKETQDLVASR